MATDEKTKKMTDRNAQMTREIAKERAGGVPIAEGTDGNGVAPSNLEEWADRAMTEVKKCASAVEQPAHYQAGEFECIDVMRAIATPAEFQAHCRLTAFKYLFRLGQKGSKLTDAGKARVYAGWLEDSLREENLNGKAR